MTKVRYDARAYFSPNDKKYGFIISKGEEVVIESPPVFDELEEAQTAASQLLQESIDKLKKKGISAYRTGDN